MTEISGFGLVVLRRLHGRAAHAENSTGVANLDDHHVARAVENEIAGGAFVNIHFQLGEIVFVKGSVRMCR